MRGIQTSHHNFIKLTSRVKSLLSCTLICSNSYLLLDHVVFRISVLFGRDIIKKKDIFFIHAPTALKPKQLDKPSVDYIIQIYAVDAIGMTLFGLFVMGALSRRQKCTH